MTQVTPKSPIKLQTENGEEELDPQNLVTVLPGDDGGPPGSRVIHVVCTDGDSLPTVKVSSTTATPIDARKYDTENIHVIISTKSGTELADKFYSQALESVLTALFPSKDASTNVHYTQSASTIRDLGSSVFWPKADNGEQLLIVLLSGDGGIVDLVNALSSKQPSAAYKPPHVAIFPLGTGNALAHSIGVSKDNTFGLSTLARGEPRPLPVFSATFSPGARVLVDEARSEELLPSGPDGTPTLYGAVVLSWAMHASLVADSDTAEYRKFGIERFKMAAKEALYPADGSLPHPYKAKVSVLRSGTSEWEDLSGDAHMYVLATLVSNLEKTFVISPASKPLDGHLRLVHFGPGSGDEAMRIMGLAYQGGKHVEDPAVGYEDLQGLRIQFEGLEKESRWRRICVDGMIVRVEEDGWVEVTVDKRNVIDVLCPPKEAS